MVDPLKAQSAEGHVQRGEKTPMSDITNVQATAGAGYVSSVNAKGHGEAHEPEPSLREGDTVQISTVATMLAKIRELPEVRMDKVVPIKHAIRQGTYDIEARLDVAIERMLEDLT